MQIGSVIAIDRAPERQDGKPGPMPHFNAQIHGLRGVSALLVFVYHIHGMASVWGFWPPQWTVFSPVFIAGQYGVEIFFVISGYLIVQSVLRHRSARGFLIDRALRIYPAFLVIHCLVFAIGPALHWDWMAGITPRQWVIAFCENIFLLPGILAVPLAQKSAWSLSYEAVFYFVASLSFVAYRWGGMAMAAAVASLCAFYLIPHYPRSAPFLAGIAVFMLSRNGSITVPQWVRLLSPVLFVATLALAFFRDVVPMASYWLILPAFFFFASIVEGKCWLSAILRYRGLQYLGTISYSFYLWAGVISYPIKLMIAHLLIGRVGPMWIVLGFTVLFLPATILISDLSYRFVEIRFARWTRKEILGG